MRTVVQKPMDPQIEEICQRYQSLLEQLIRELREAGVNPSPNYFGEGSNSLTVIANGVPITIGRAEYSESNKARLRKLDWFEKTYEQDS